MSSSRRARWARAMVGLVVAVSGAVSVAATPAQAAGPVMVSLTFDDGLTTQWRAGAILKRHGVRATYYLNSGAVDSRGGYGTMSWTWAKELAAAGHEIGGHTRDHIDLTQPGLTLQEKWRQVCDDRARLLGQGFPANTFAYAAGNLDDTAVAIVQACGYQSARKAGGLLPTGPAYADRSPPMDGVHRVRALGTTDNGPITLEALTAAVEAAHSNGGGWLPMLFHRVCFPEAADYPTCMETFRPVDSGVLDQFAAWLTAPEQRSRGIEAGTMSGVLNGGRAVPRVTVTAPTAGAATSAHPQFTGRSSTGGAVTVRIYRGRYGLGAPVRELTTTVGGGTWAVAPAAPLERGTYTVRATVTLSGVTGSSLPVAFATGARTGPVLAELSRDLVGQGARNEPITLRGRNLSSATATVTGSGVRMRLLRRSATALKVAVTVGPDAAPGRRTVTVTSSSGARSTCVGCLRIVGGPKVTAVVPGSVGRGGLSTVIVRGAGFREGSKVLVAGKGVTVRQVQVLAHRRLRVSVSVTPGAVRSARSVSVLDPVTRGRGVLPRSLRIT